MPTVVRYFSALWWALCSWFAMLCTISLCGPIGSFSGEAWGLCARRLGRRGGPWCAGVCNSWVRYGFWGCNSAQWCVALGAEARQLCSIGGCPGIWMVWEGGGMMRGGCVPVWFGFCTGVCMRCKCMCNAGLWQYSMGRGRCLWLYYSALLLELL